MLFLPNIIWAQDVESVHALFDSLKVHPQTIADELDMQMALAGKKIAYGKLYPNIGLFGTYDYANTPTGMLPIAPNDLLSMVQDPTVAQPFSEQIMRAGASIAMPIFVKSIYTMAAKAKMMYKSAKDKQYINLLKNEATIVSLNANLQYMEHLTQSLEKKRQSLDKTKQIIEIKVKSQRAPKSALLLIDNGLNQIDIALDNIEINKSELVAKLQILTGVTLHKSIDMELVGTFTEGELKALDPLTKKVEADKLGLRAEKEKLLPVVMLHGNYNHSMATSYNNNQSVNEDFATIGLLVKIPLFAKDQYAQISKSKIEIQASENRLENMKLQLLAQTEQLQNNLKLINTKIELYTKSVNDKKELQEIAKVAYSENRITIEDYLKYEDDLVLEESNLYKAQTEKWQTIMKLAVIYGNSIEDIIK